MDLGRSYQQIHDLSCCEPTSRERSPVVSLTVFKCYVSSLASSSKSIWHILWMYTTSLLYHISRVHVMHIKKTAIVARRYSLAQGREHIDHATRLLVLSVFASQVSTPVPSEIATHYIPWLVTHQQTVCIRRECCFSWILFRFCSHI